MKNLTIIWLCLFLANCSNTTDEEYYAREITRELKKYNETVQEADRKYIEQYLERREMFNIFLNDHNITEKRTCPGCGYPTMEVDTFFNPDICAVCAGKIDREEGTIENEYWHEDNRCSLTEMRVHIGQILEGNASELEGQINENPKEVWEILQNSENRLLEIISSMPIDVASRPDSSHPKWKEWAEEKEKLIPALIKK